MNLSEKMGWRMRHMRNGKGNKMWSHPMPLGAQEEDPELLLKYKMARLGAERAKREKRAGQLRQKAVAELGKHRLQFDGGGDYFPGEAGFEQAAERAEQAGPA
jgi:hypothetical protein